MKARSRSSSNYKTMSPRSIRRYKQFEAKKVKVENDKAVHNEIKNYTRTVDHKPAFYFYKKRNKGLLNYLKRQTKGFCNMIGDLSEEPIVTAKKNTIRKTKFRKHIPSEYLFLNEFPDQHDETDTKLFYLKEINNYIGSGRLKKFINSDMLLETYPKDTDHENELFNHKVYELGFEAALDSLMK